MFPLNIGFSCKISLKPIQWRYLMVWWEKMQPQSTIIDSCLVWQGYGMTWNDFYVNKKLNQHRHKFLQLVFLHVEVSSKIIGTPTPWYPMVYDLMLHIKKFLEIRQTGSENGEPALCDMMRITLTHRIHGAGIYANIWGILMVNVTIYGIHGSYGLRYPVARVMFSAIFSERSPRHLQALAEERPKQHRVFYLAGHLAGMWQIQHFDGFFCSHLVKANPATIKYANPRGQKNNTTTKWSTSTVFVVLFMVFSH